MGPLGQAVINILLERWFPRHDCPEDDHAPPRTPSSAQTFDSGRAGYVRRPPPLAARPLEPTTLASAVFAPDLP